MFLLLLGLCFCWLTAYNSTTIPSVQYLRLLFRTPIGSHSLPVKRNDQRAALMTGSARNHLWHLHRLRHGDAAIGLLTFWSCCLLWNQQSLFIKFGYFTIAICLQQILSSPATSRESGRASMSLLCFPAGNWLPAARVQRVRTAGLREWRRLVGLERAVVARSSVHRAQSTHVQSQTTSEGPLHRSFHHAHARVHRDLHGCPL